MQQNKGKNINFNVAYLLLVPHLCFGLAAVCNVLILSTDFSHNGIHIKVTAVVHLHNNGGVLNLSLQLTKLLHKEVAELAQLFRRIMTKLVVIILYQVARFQP